MAESDRLSNKFPWTWAVCVSTWLAFWDKDRLCLPLRHVRMWGVWIMSHYVFLHRSQKFSPQNRQGLFIMIIMIVRAMHRGSKFLSLISPTFSPSSWIRYFNVPKQPSWLQPSAHGSATITLSFKTQMGSCITHAVSTMLCHALETQKTIMIK